MVITVTQRHCTIPGLFFFWALLLKHRKSGLDHVFGWLFETLKTNFPVCRKPSHGKHRNEGDNRSASSALQVGALTQGGAHHDPFRHENDPLLLLWEKHNFPPAPPSSSGETNNQIDMRQIKRRKWPTLPCMCKQEFHKIWDLRTDRALKAYIPSLT